MEKTYPTFYGEYGERQGKSDYFSVNIVVFTTSLLEQKTINADVHWPLAENLWLFVRDVADEYGEGSILSIATSRMGS